MSRNGLEVMDKSIQTTNIWLDEIMERVVPDRHAAWHLLGAVLRVLRDRLPIDETAHLGAQLPLVIRGLYYDQWHPAGTPTRERHQEEFLARVAAGIADIRPIDPKDGTKAVFAVIARHVSPGEVRKICASLPLEIRALWPDTVGGSAQAA
jgi:uncharacterized protein (DUF2267 family)